MAVDGKISDVNEKVTEFEQLTEKSADDNTAIIQLESVTTLLDDVSGFLTVGMRGKRSVDSKTNISLVRFSNKNTHRLYKMDQFERKVCGHPVNTILYQGAI